ncbi:MAG: tetratricopeptide repeat protein [Steroidobacteraceae bacterium]|nr:tetratricopeptide repeat protein [Deltaproteobacteria bacterium]
MKYEQFAVFLVFLMTALLSGGCATDAGKSLPPPPPPTTTTTTTTREVPEAERYFSAALHFMRTGNESGAREQLERIVGLSALVGVTDEALFRLAILNLRDEYGRGETRARKLLERLVTEFPDSSWSSQAAPLLVYIQETATLRARTRALKSLRNQNLTLGRDNKELRQSIERLKDLDLELEQKIRR